MPEPTTKSSRGGKRPGAGNPNWKPISGTARTAVIHVRVEPDLKEWVESNGGSKLIHSLLERARIESLIV